MKQSMSRKQLFKQQWDQSYEFEKLKKLHKSAKNYSNKDFIPCMFIKGRSKKIIIHFHANGEDISLTQPLMERISSKTRANVICMEYPGYGIYKETNTTTTQQKAKLILQDAEVVLKFITETCGVKLSDVLISGRSIGSGPACHLAAKFKPACLILISPIKSVKDAARMMYGRVADFFIEERFDNFSVAKNVVCPTAIFHGMNDNMVPYQHSMEMLINGFIKAQTHMFLRDGMEHNRIDYINDIIKPMRYFLKLHQIHMRPSKSVVKNALLDQKLQKNFGYIDKKAIKTGKLLGIINRSQYYNNFEQKFIPELPECQHNGKYTNQIVEPSWHQNDQELESLLASPMISTTFGEESFDTANSKSFLAYQNAIICGQQLQQRHEIMKNTNITNLSQIQSIEIKSSKHRGVSIDFQPIKSKQQQHQQSYVNDINDQSKNPNIPDDSQRIDTNEEDIADINTSLILNSMNLPNLLNQTKPQANPMTPGASINTAQHNIPGVGDFLKIDQIQDNLQDISKISRLSGPEPLDPKETITDSFNDTDMCIDEEHKREIELDIVSKLKQQEQENGNRQYRNASNYLQRATNATKSQQQLSTVCDNRVPGDIANIDKQYIKEPDDPLEAGLTMPLVRNALSEHSQSDGEANINDTIDDIAYMSQKEAQINKLQLDSIPRHNIIGTSPQFQRAQGQFGTNGSGSALQQTEKQPTGIQTNNTDNTQNLFSQKNKQIRLKRLQNYDLFHIAEDYYQPPIEQISAHKEAVEKHLKIFQDQELQSRINTQNRINQDLLDQKFNTVQSLKKDAMVRQTAMHYHQLQMKAKKVNKESMSQESLRIHQNEEIQNLRDAPQQMAPNLKMSIKKRNTGIDNENYASDIITQSTKLSNKLTHCHSEVEKTQKLTFKKSKEYFTVTKNPYVEGQQKGQIPIQDVKDFTLEQFDSLNEIEGDEEAWDISEQLKGKTAAHSHYATQISSKTLANQIKKTKLNQQRIIPPSVMPINKTFRKTNMSDTDTSQLPGAATQRATVASPRILFNTNIIQQKKERSNSVKRHTANDYLQALGAVKHSVISEPSFEDSAQQTAPQIVRNTNSTQVFGKDSTQQVSAKKRGIKHDDVIQSNRVRQDHQNYFSNKQLIQKIQTLSPRHSARALNSKYSKLTQNSQPSALNTIQTTPASSLKKKESSNTNTSVQAAQAVGNNTQVRVSYRQSGAIHANPVAEKSKMKNTYLQNNKEQQKLVSNTSGRWTTRQDVKNNSQKLQMLKGQSTQKLLEQQKLEHNQKKASLLKFQQLQSDKLPKTAAAAAVQYCEKQLAPISKQKMVKDSGVLSARHPNVSKELSLKRKNDQQHDKLLNPTKNGKRIFQNYQTGPLSTKYMSRTNRAFQHISQKSTSSIQTVPILNDAITKAGLNQTQAISLQGCCSAMNKPKNSFSINLTSDNFRPVKKK